MASSTRTPKIAMWMRALACLGATLLAVACSDDGDGSIESLIGYEQTAVEQLELADCEVAELDRALQDNAEELLLARAESAALAAMQGTGAGASQPKANLNLTTAANETTRHGAAIPGGPARPDLIARVEEGKAYFWRPELGRRYYLVVPAEVPSAYFYAAVLATHVLEGALADDCLDEVFTVIRQADYAELHPAVRERSSPIEVGYSEDACLDLAAGCSNSPRLEPMSLGEGLVEERMRLGTYLGLETDYDTARDRDDAPDLTPARARNVILHELSHLLGFEHPRYSQLEPDLDEGKVRVPQSSQGTVRSFFFPTASPLFSPLPTPEDRRVLARVYAGDCEYRPEYRLLGEVCSSHGELSCQLHGGSCEVAHAPGGERVERCRWHDFREEAACTRYSAGTWHTPGADDPTVVFAGEAGACLASELPECLPVSSVSSREDLAGRCCTLFGQDERGLLFEGFSAGEEQHYFCSHQKGLGPPSDSWEFSAASEGAELTLLVAGSGAAAEGWGIREGELVQELELPGNLALTRERMRSGCVTTRVSGEGVGESGIVFNYRAAGSYYVFDATPNVRRRIRRVVDGVSTDLSVEPWPAPGGWAAGVELTVCYGDGIHTFIGGRLDTRVSVAGRVEFVGSGGRLGLWNEGNPGARHDYLRAFSLVEGYALLRR